MLSTGDLNVGDPAPDFILTADDGSSVMLSDYRGKRVVLYFYPRDDTSGCTTQACDLRDNLGDLTDVGAVVLGVSPDSRDSHERFKAKHDLNFLLLVDDDHVAAHAYGVWKEKTSPGGTTMGIERSTFVVDEKGALEAVWRRVQPAEHVDRLREHFGLT